MFLRWAPQSKFILAAVLLVAIAHIGVAAMPGQALLASNIIQLLAELLPVYLCLDVARRQKDTYFRNAWLTLTVAFGVGTVGQSYFLVHLIRNHGAPAFPSVADFMWMFFAFPILWVTVVRRSWKRTEWVTWLDGAQSCLFFCVLYTLICSRPPILPVAVAYDVQAAALVLACALRFSSTQPGPERTFFRNLGVYLIVYGCCSSLGDRLQESGLNRGAWPDLCWSGPSLLFCLLVIFSKLDSTPPSRRVSRVEAKVPKYLRGLSAAGLSMMSVFGAVALHSRHQVSGLAMLLAAFLIFALRTTAREAQLTEAHGTLERAVYRDGLTGLSNRIALLNELTLILQEKEVSDSSVAVVYIDLDRFKSVNDSLGHIFGDRLLVHVAGVLKAQIGIFDCVARLGGDEFAIILESTSQAEASAFARNLVRLFQEPISLDGRVLYLTASVGVSMCRPGVAAEDMLCDADCAMYSAKNKGKNQEQSFDVGMLERVKASLSLESDLRQALRNGDLEVYYQPLFYADDRGIIGFEALSRWHHPSKGFISPAQFIPIAEETGLIMQLGTQVLREACRQIRKWNEQQEKSYFVSVNVSAPQFADSRLAETILSVLEETGLAPELLKLEITESVLVGGVDAVEAVLTKLRRKGIKIALDDFGTGYSSLSYLLTLPFDVVKIDRSFVRSFTDDAKREEILRTIVRLVKIMDKQVVAEGVETLAERCGLQEMGCDILQGFYLAKPMAACLIDALLTPTVSAARPTTSESSAWLKPSVSEGSAVYN